MIDLMPIYLSLKLAILTTGILFFVGIAVGYFLAFVPFKSKPIIESAINLPLILPPSVLGFYLLFVFNPDNPFGSVFIKLFNRRLLFSFDGLLIAALIFSFPIMVNFCKSGFRSFPTALKDTSNIMGKSNLKTLVFVILPYCSSSVLNGAIMTFVHTLGAFGILMMIGGNIPGETQLASIAIFNEIECLNYHKAHIYSLVLVGITFFLLLIMLKLGKQKKV